MADLYKILGIDKDASDDEIKRAYRKLAHKHHPDKKGGDEEKFKEINGAYQTLSDKTKRAQYDQFGQTFDGAGGAQGGGAQGGFGGFGGEAGGFDFSGFSGAQGGGFSGAFSDFFNGYGEEERGKGRDIQVEIEIDFMEMITGVKKTVKLYKSVKCEVCKGGGGAVGSKEETCKTCQGQGRIKKTMQSILGTIAQEVICSDCQGQGKTFSEKCKECGGDGRVKKEVEIPIEIPAGISNGQTISIRDQGEAGEHGASNGDLFVNVFIREHQDFKRRGDDIISKQEISFSQATLGDKIEIKTAEGPVTMKIPAGTKSGEVFRIRSKGVPHLRGGGRGHHLVEITVVIPKRLNRSQKKLIRELGELGL